MGHSTSHAAPALQPVMAIIRGFRMRGWSQGQLGRVGETLHFMEGTAWLRERGDTHNVTYPIRSRVDAH